jgi:hypothetical protein
LLSGRAKKWGGKPPPKVAVIYDRVIYPEIIVAATATKANATARKARDVHIVLLLMNPLC